MPSKQRDTGAIHVFLSFSHGDRTWLERLRKMLKPLLRQGSFACGDDTKIRGSDRWRREIAAALAWARVAVLLVSADSLDSDPFLSNSCCLGTRGKEAGYLRSWVSLPMLRMRRRQSGPSRGDESRYTNASIVADIMLPMPLPKRSQAS